MSEYKTIGDYAEAFSGYPFSSEDLVEDGVPVIKIGNIQNGIVVKECDSCYQKEITGKLKRYILDSDDFLIAMTGAGSVGRAGKMRGSTETVYLVNQRVAIVRTRDNANPDYLFYYFSMPYVERYLYSLGIGAGQPNISAKDIMKTKVAFPDKNVQDKIADILVKYDELIDCNKLRIKILEQMAENLYKEWFVRFRFPGHEDVEFEGGKPKEWIIKSMVDFCYVTDGTHDTPKETESGVPLVTGKSISNGFINFEETYNISVEDHNKIAKRSGLKSGDILFSNIGTVGNCCIVHYDREFSVKNVIIFKPDTIDKTAYLYYWMNNDTMQSIFKAQTNGASQQFVGLNFMRKYKILIPTNDILSRFSDYVVHIIGEKNKLRQANSNLRKQRDLLLPRLMSGKIKVK